MLTSARKTMPALDYVSIIRSVYGDRRAMLAGSFASVVIAAMSAYKTQSLALYLVAAAFVLIGAIRDFDMRAFARAAIGSDDAMAAEYWENRSVVFGGMLALVYGSWCFVSMVIVRDPFAELASASISIAVMVGICGRNFGLDRLVTIQMVGVIAPLSAGYALHGDVYHAVLAALLGIMLASFRKLAGDIRTILLSAVHGRVEASRLAAELDMAMATLEHGLCLLDEKGVISVTNEQAVRFFSLMGQTSLIGMPLASVLSAPGVTQALPRTAIDRLMDMVGRVQPGKVLLSLSGGRHFEVTVSARHTRCVLLFEDISERVASEERIHHMARHDMLTELPNRTYFGELVADDLLDRQRPNAPSRVVSLMIIDIDDFKHVNDSFGHVVGDQLLVQVANRLRETLPAGVILARLGGDEFIAYRSTIDETARFDADAKRTIAAFAAPFSIDDLTLQVNISIGLVSSCEPRDEFDDLMTKADLALYSAKGTGKARSQVFHTQMDIDYHYKQRLKADLREAVRTGGLSLAFQPLVDMTSRRVVTCEALARWNHPELGPIAPSTFIPIAEETGLISDVTAWVLKEATLQCQSWPDDVSVAVNVSARDFRGIDLASVVDAALADAGLAPSRLEIEVTESAVIEEHGTAKSVLSGLAAKGIGVALDDFGTGYSSLSYLSALPFSKLKIDRSFVAGIETDQRLLRLLANVARLGRDLNLTVVAEGVETAEQLELIQSKTKVQQVQGYLFSKPVPADAISGLIGKFNGFATVPTMRRHG